MSSSNDILREYLKVSRRVSEQFRAYYGKLSLTYPQSIVLAILEADGPMPISSLAEAAGSANSTISGVLDRLESIGLVQRLRSDADRRVIYVSVTDQFRDHFEEVRDSAADRFERKLARMSEEETDTIRRGLDLLNRALEAEET